MVGEPAVKRPPPESVRHGGRPASIHGPPAYPHAATARLAAAGMLALRAPRRLGGGGLQIPEILRRIATLAEISPQEARLVADANLGGVGTAYRLGSEAQQDRIAQAARGGLGVATARRSGGTLRADRTATGWRLQGGPILVPGGEGAALSLIVAQTGRFGRPRVFLLDRDRIGPGVVIRGRAPDPGLCALPALSFSFHEVEAPPSAALEPLCGPEDTLAAMAAALAERRLGEAAIAIGLARGALSAAFGTATGGARVAEQALRVAAPLSTAPIEPGLAAGAREAAYKAAREAASLTARCASPAATRLRRERAPLAARTLGRTPTTTITALPVNNRRTSAAAAGASAL